MVFLLFRSSNIIVLRSGMQREGLRRRASQGQRLRQLVVRAKAKEIAFDQASRSSLQCGVEKLANAVGVTLGPRGIP